MKTITHNSNFGRFAYTANAEIGDEVNEATTKLCLEGLASVCYRAGGSEAEKALVKDGNVKDVNGKAITKDTKRSEVAFSEAAMEVLQTSFEAKMKEVVAKNGLPGVTVLFTGEHEFGEGAGSSRKRATEYVDALIGKDEVVPGHTMSHDALLRLGLSLHDPKALTANREELIEIAHQKMFSTKK